MVQKTSAVRLHFLDGLRGFASFYVLLFHETTTKFAGTEDPSPVMRFVRAWLHEGHFGVVVFIVLSGYSLMLPIARVGDGKLVGSFREYVRRRARRILPPYYAALVFSAGLLVLYNTVAVRMGLGKPVDEAALSAGSIVSHLFLFHNLHFDWVYRINGPAWSVATEWQIYFVFVLLLLPILRRLGIAATVVIAWVVGALPFFALPENENFFWAGPWLLGSFAFGMWGAVICFSPSHQASWFRMRAPWEAISLAFFAGLVVLSATGLSNKWSYPVVDFFVSLFAISLINACATRQARGFEKKSLVHRILDSRAFVVLGAFSYSLYLVQHPILRLTEKLFGRLGLGFDAYMLVQLVVSTPLVAAFAWLFAEFFERPFTGGGVVLPALRRRFAPAAPAAPENPR